MRKRLPLLASPRLILALGLATMTAPAMAQDNPAAHQHGHAELQVAFAGEQIDLLLESPAWNLLGFEHQPRTKEQRQKLDGLREWVAANALINTEGGNCRVTTSELHTGWEGHEAHDDQGHDHGHDQDAHANHSNLEITQSLRCAALPDASAFTAPILDAFPALEHLDVQWVSAQGQGGTRLTRSDNRFRPGQ
tara:strand:+ start:1551 stop:2129 length:579 start_codon:yes stop_codon:yes gene_type:complete